jgi:O-antigen ligase
MLLYALGSTVESGMSVRDGKAMVYTLIVAASVFALSFLAIAKMPGDSIRKFLWRLTVFLAFTGLIYTMMSFTAFEMGDVGASANADLEAQGFGIARVKGPLYIADNGHFALIPALAFAIQELISNPRQKLLKIAVLFTLMMTLLGLGSRAAILILFLFFLMLLLFLKNKKQAIAAIVLLVTIVSIAGWVVFSRADASRLQSIEDTSRSETHATALQIVTNRDFELNIIGSGYGSYWPSWYLYDSTGDDLRDLGLFYTLVYPYGHVIYHPHSTFLIFFVELGLVGWLYFIYLWIVLIGLLVSNLRGTALPVFNCGMAASGLSMFFEFFIFKNYQVTVVWLLFFFGALSFKSEKSSQKTLNKSSISR